MPTLQPDLPFGRDAIIVRSPRSLPSDSPQDDRYALPPDRPKTEAEIIRGRSTEDLEERLARLNLSIDEDETELSDEEDRSLGFSNKMIANLKRRIEQERAERERIHAILATRVAVQSTTHE